MSELWVFLFVFFKQKTAYEMRISDWSSDVCSSDLVGLDAHEMAIAEEFVAAADRQLVAQQRLGRHDDQRLAEIAQHLPTQDVEIIGRRRDVADLDIVARAQQKEAFETSRAWFRPPPLTTRPPQKGGAVGPETRRLPPP